jgi:ribosomal protein S18 acetylase RimI-like enzyme
MLRVVTDADGRVAAVACIVLTERQEAYIDRLATRADQRHRGLAQALMVDAFRAGREKGATTSGLSTDSRTGALGLYQKVGMVVVDGWVNRAIDL